MPAVDAQGRPGVVAVRAGTGESGATPGGIRQPLVGIAPHAYVVSAFGAQAKSAIKVCSFITMAIGYCDHFEGPQVSHYEIHDYIHCVQKLNFDKPVRSHDICSSWSKDCERRWENKRPLPAPNHLVGEKGATVQFFIELLQMLIYHIVKQIRYSRYRI